MKFPAVVTIAKLNLLKTDPRSMETAADDCRAARERLEDLCSKYQKQPQADLIQQTIEMENLCRVSNAECMIITLALSERQPREKKSKTHAIQHKLNNYSKELWKTLNLQCQAKAKDMMLLKP